MSQLPDQLPDPLAGQPLAQAARDAVDAASNSRQLEIVAAILQAQQITQIAQAAQQQPCQHHAPKQEFNAKKWIVIGGVTCAGSLAFALASVAIAIGATCATACLLVLRSMWREYMSGKS
jgi:hypothetical protein